jgi:hypothetical protein
LCFGSANFDDLYGLGQQIEHKIGDQSDSDEIGEGKQPTKVSAEECIDSKEDLQQIWQHPDREVDIQKDHDVQERREEEKGCGCPSSIDAEAPAFCEIAALSSNQNAGVLKERENDGRRKHEQRYEGEKSRERCQRGHWLGE